MADARTRMLSPVHKVRATSKKLFQADALADRVLNMYPTAEGTLRSVRGPAPFLPDYSSGGAPADGAAAIVGTPVYGRTKGIHHVRLKGGMRDILLLHTGDQLWEFEGWRKGWRMLIGPTTASGGPGLINADLETVDRPEFPTMFVNTPNGVVIIPQNRRAYFYNGEIILPLGYTHRPSPPTPHGPRDSATELVDDQEKMGINNSDYAHDALPRRNSGMHRLFCRGRLGLTVHPTNYNQGYESDIGYEGDAKAVAMGWLERGEYRAKAQLVDIFGNLSPQSYESDPVTFSRQPSTGWVFEDVDGVATTPPDGISYYVISDLALKQIAWSGFKPGPQGTVGRIVGRTKNITQTGDTDFYEVPLNARAAAGAFATLPDNNTRIFPDNVPDSWLINKLQEVDPVPMFKVAAVAFNRLWVGNWPGGEGAIRPSLPGLWGTFPPNKEQYPDSSAAEITGLHACNRGLLVFTATSTFLIESNDSGEGFRAVPLSTKIGCVAPASIATDREGVAIWLGAEGFYGYDGSGAPRFLFEDNREDSKEFTRARLKQAVAVFDSRSNEYRCWLSVNGAPENRRCYALDDQGWRTLDHVWASGACVTQDDREYNIVCGKEGGSSDGVWVLDHEVQDFAPQTRSHTIETGWISSVDSRSRKSPKRIFLWLRETASSTSDSTEVLTATFCRDWRDEVVVTSTAELRPETGLQPEFWDAATLGAADSPKWRKARPYWYKLDVSLPSCEVFKVKLTTQKNWEFVGIQFAESSRDAGGANLPG